MQYFTDQVRGALLKALPGDRIISRENLLELLKIAGKSLEQCEGECDVETGRNIGADLIISGELVRVGNSIKASLRLHDTRSGDLIATVNASGKTPEQLDASIAGAVKTMVEPVRSPRASPPLESGSARARLLIRVDVPAHCEVGKEQARVEPGTPWVVSVPAGSATVVCSDDGPEEVIVDLQASPGAAVPVPVKVSRPAEGRAGESKVEPKSGVQLILIPGGRFHFGCEPKDKACLDDERGYDDSVDAFWLARSPTTVAAYARCVRAGACTEPGETDDKCNWGKREDHPVNCVDWKQAVSFCAWMGGRLPTAEEWEYAAKGGEGRIYPWGDERPDGPGVHYGRDKNGTTPVGSYPPSKWGLVDMAGNVEQWTATEHGPIVKEVRGSSWGAGDPHFMRSSFRLPLQPGPRVSQLGFRCAQ